MFSMSKVILVFFICQNIEFDIQSLIDLVDLF